MQEIKNQSELDKLMEQGPVVVDFWAPWCGPCRAIGPIFEQASKDNEGVTFVKCNIDDAPELAKEYGISAIPTLKFLNKNVTQDTVTGVPTASGLQSKIDNLLQG